MKMKEPDLTNEAIRRLQASPIEVKLINGAYQRATAVAQFARHRFELSVEVTHPSMEWQCGAHNEINLTVWTGCNGAYKHIEDTLWPLVETMKQKATMTDEEAMQLCIENKRVFHDAMISIGM
jgi:hypothetical protein